MSMIHIIDYAKRFVGVPYRWGGNSVLEGFDCSGLVCEILRAAGIVDRCDYSSQGIFDLITKKNHRNVRRAGSIAFYGKNSANIYHVAFHLDEFLVIEAGGGDASIKTLDDAIKKNAVVRIRKFDNRKDYLFSILPDYATIGLVL